jgi:myo-inositol-1(or 4)-monophosphatase
MWSSMPATAPDTPRPLDLVPLARHARRLAHQAGEQLQQALGSERTVRWKYDDTRRRSAVSDLDESLEQTVRAGIRTVFPAHAIVGEEHEDAPSRDSPITWVIDPIDGTANFTNGVPLFAVSIGVLHGTRPVAGAIWCAATHRLGSGVYHGTDGGALYLDDDPVPAPPAHAVRGIVSEPGGPSTRHDFGDTRVLGSAAIECAWAAAGILRAAVLGRPRIWDVAAGVVLARAAGCDVFESRDQRLTWTPFTVFDGDDETPLREWSRPLTLGRIGTVLAPAAGVNG